MNFYIPETLNLKERVPNLSQKELDKFHYFINLLYEQRILYKIKSEFIPLKAVYLRSVLGANHTKYTKPLEEMGIINCDHWYQMGKKSFGYKLSDEFLNKKLKKVPCLEKIVINSIKKIKKITPISKIHQHLYNFLSKINIDQKTIEEFDKSDINIISLDKIYNKEFYLYSDDYGRIHTNVTNMKSSLRKFLKFDNHNLVNIDISNSQPLFLNVVINQIKSRNKLNNNVSNVIIRSYKYNNIYSSSIPSRCTEEEKDLINYSNLVQEGTLYDFLMEKSKIKNRDIIKENLFKETLFGNRVEGLFVELFPTVAKIIKNIKSKDYRTMAWIMQKAESDMIINKICTRIMTERPEIFITTIHDSIMTLPEHVDYVSSIMLDEFKKINLIPKLKVNI